MDSMFRVTFREAQYNQDLTTLLLDAVPSVGESVYLYEQSDRPNTAKAYRVASRRWHIMKRDKDNSEVVLMLEKDD